jgi:hypothetical protein
MGHKNTGATPSSANGSPESAFCVQGTAVNAQSALVPKSSSKFAHNIGIIPGLFTTWLECADEADKTVVSVVEHSLFQCSAGLFDKLVATYVHGVCYTDGIENFEHLGTTAAPVVAYMFAGTAGASSTLTLYKHVTDKGGCITDTKIASTTPQANPMTISQTCDNRMKLTGNTVEKSTLREIIAFSHEDDGNPSCADLGTTGGTGYIGAPPITGPGNHGVVNERLYTRDAVYTLNGLLALPASGDVPLYVTREYARNACHGTRGNMRMYQCKTESGVPEDLVAGASCASTFLTCPASYSCNTGGHCCPDNCKTCTSAGVCSACNTGFGFAIAKVGESPTSGVCINDAVYGAGDVCVVSTTKYCAAGCLTNCCAVVVKNCKTCGTAGRCTECDGDYNLIIGEDNDWCVPEIDVGKDCELEDYGKKSACAGLCRTKCCVAAPLIENAILCKTCHNDATAKAVLPKSAAGYCAECYNGFELTGIYSATAGAVTLKCVPKATSTSAVDSCTSGTPPGADGCTSGTPPGADGSDSTGGSDPASALSFVVAFSAAVFCALA